MPLSIKQKTSRNTAHRLGVKLHVSCALDCCSLWPYKPATMQQVKTPSSNPSLAHSLPPLTLTRLAQEWLAEDTPHLDPAGVCVGTKEVEAKLLCKSPNSVLAGSPFFTAVFREVGCSVEWRYQDGERIGADAVTLTAVVKGPANCLLLGERPALNCLARASGIATRCSELRTSAAAVGWSGEVAGTRKTTPGFRLVEKYAMLVGGASTHRHDLSGMVMLKDNHVWASGSITEVKTKALLIRISKLWKRNKISIRLKRLLTHCCF
ncbi:hypothetical protein NQD34_000524 [Periophthalmus magnuspinnatus]|nr:hypothetical protein NQD34_000524 [Periophthalmus magnuspinnatus]